MPSKLNHHSYIWDFMGRARSLNKKSTSVLFLPSGKLLENTIRKQHDSWSCCQGSFFLPAGFQYKMQGDGLTHN